MMMAACVAMIVMAAPGCARHEKADGAQEEANEALSRRWAEAVWNRGDFGAIDELLAPDFVAHYPGFPTTDRASYKEWAEMEFRVFEDIRCTIDDLVAEEDRVALRWTWQGTHSGGDYLGIPPTGKRVTMSGMTFFRMKDGKIVEEWGVSDELGKLRLLGAAPSPGAANP